VKSARDPNRLPPWLVTALTVPPAVFLAVFYAWPFVTIVARGVGRGWRVLGRAATWDVIWFTTWQAVASTVLTLAAGLLPAYVIARYRFPGRRLLSGTLTAVFVLPTVVMGAAMLAVLPASLERTVWAILAAHVTFNLAVVVRTVGAVWEHLPPDLEAAAATLGSSPWRVARTITLPLLLPSIAAAASIVFLFTFTSFGVVRILGGGRLVTIEVEIWRRATQLGDIGAAAVLSIVQLGALGLVVTWTLTTQRRFSRALDLRPRATRRRARRPAERVLVTATAVLTALAILGPLAALVERSLRTQTGYSLAAWRHLGRPEIRPGITVGVDPLASLATSLHLAAAATLLTVVLGAAASLAIAASRRAGRLLDSVIMLPIGTSAVTIGFGMLITFDRAPVDWRASWWLIPVGHALVALPFVVRVAIGVLRGIDPQLHQAAATLGASPARAWREVTLPFLWRPLAVGAGLAAAISLGEFGATSFLSRRGSETMPIAIDRLLGRTGALLQAQGYALAAVLAAVTIAVVLLLDRGGS
jgi:thiamine transport system permease protein